jgi:hypothetical protein
MSWSTPTVPPRRPRCGSDADRASELTFLNLTMVQPELWAWGRRDGYTVGLVRLPTEAGTTGIGEVNVCMGADDA